MLNMQYTAIIVSCATVELVTVDMSFTSFLMLQTRYNKVAVPMKSNVHLTTACIGIYV